MNECPPPDMDIRPQGLFGPLFEIILRRMQVEVNAELSGFGLRLLHLCALSVLDTLGKQSQADLTEAVRVDKTTMVGLLNDLETSGLVERQRSPEDRRRHDVVLTPLGKRQHEVMVEALSGAERRVLAALSAEQRDTVYTLLEQALTLPAAHSAQTGSG